MIMSVRKEIEKSHEVYPKLNHVNWVLQWAGQVVLCVAMIHWTEEVQQGLRLEQVGKLRECHRAVQVRLNSVLLQCYKYNEI
jgi:hypothetical protein